jgi:hypothetical protein
MNWKRFGYQCFAVLNPNCWLRGGKTDCEWDEGLWQAIDQGRVSHVGEFHAIVGGVLVWIENCPYASGTTIPTEMPRRIFTHCVFCSRATAIYLNRSLPAARLIDKLMGFDQSAIHKAHNKLQFQSRDD